MCVRSHRAQQAQQACGTHGLAEQDRQPLALLAHAPTASAPSVLLCLRCCRVLATSRTPYYQQAAEMGAEFYEDPDDFCEEHPDVVILATSILSTEPVLRSLPLTRLKRSTLVVDVLSVKVGHLWLECLLHTRAQTHMRA